MSRQRGVVLLLALVLSMLLALLAASALGDAIVETRMTGYLSDGLLALDEAEAALLAGKGELERAPPEPCTVCLPPNRPHDLLGQWQRTQNGYFQLQNLGQSHRAAHLPVGQPVTLFRITAVSKQTQSRHVLEAVYAVADGLTQRISWRQRLRGD
ncbi:hypothetical protein DV532_03230 [Pseudomonas sp. Leaf58]|uniref:hypothetical protein n=1 Tax=Pseudomonas TaxID=286 RepID=UPI0006F8D6C2|nr:hypothetical protein [Pseudomonas sp. Leaf58]AYG43371.1 hypothetical protein DV532_03230 [Pseudomonas sp. Leaf58]KQN66847.1 hypothetical protein ASF02_04355 [Pseudomonas sp. Leaf58]